MTTPNLNQLLVSKESPKEQEQPKQDKQFRVISFAYQFKTGSSVIKADKFGVYTPANAEERAYLEYQVKMQRIAFS